MIECNEVEEDMFKTVSPDKSMSGYLIDINMRE